MGQCVGVLLYLALCAATVLSGWGLLRLLRLNLPQLPALLLGPLLTFLLWSLIFALAGTVSVPLKYIVPWAWALTACLALVALPRVLALARSAGPLLALCAVLPLIVLFQAFAADIQEDRGCSCPDGWWYMAIGQNLWDRPRHDADPQGPLQEFAAAPFIRDTRYVSYSLLAFLSPLTRHQDTQAVCGLYQAWILFCLGCSVAFFWVSEQRRTWEVVAGTTLSVACGWMSNLLWIYNLDNGLALVYLPVVAGVLRLMSAHQWRLWALLGAMAASICYTFPQGAPFILLGGGLLAWPRMWRERSAWVSWLGGSAVAVGVAVLLLAPGYQSLVATTRDVYHASVAAHRPGEEVFLGLKNPTYQISALWGLGGEFDSDKIGPLRQRVALVLSALALLGAVVLAYRRRWDLLGVLALYGAGTYYFLFQADYAYGAFKWLILGWWLVITCVAMGLMFLTMGLLGMGNGAVFQVVPQRFPKEIGVLTGVVGAAGGLGGFVLPTLLGGAKETLGSFGFGFLGFALVSLACAAALLRPERATAAAAERA